MQQIGTIKSMDFRSQYKAELLLTDLFSPLPLTFEKTNNPRPKNEY